MKSLILLLLWSVFSAQAGLMPFGCSFGGLCGKPPDKSNAPVTPPPTQKLNPPPSNPNNNTTYTNSSNPSQSGTQSPKPAPTLPNLNQPPKRLPPPKQN
jgi:hypothetical protein